MKGHQRYKVTGNRGSEDEGRDVEFFRNVREIKQFVFYNCWG